MTHIAESYVYESLDGGPGYVGRSPKGNYRLRYEPGDRVPDEVVAELELSDLIDRTDYAEVLRQAAEGGAPVTTRLLADGRTYIVSRPASEVVTADGQLKDAVE